MGFEAHLHNKALGAALIDKAGRTFRRLSRELGPRDFVLKRRNVLFAKQLSKVACRLVHLLEVLVPHDSLSWLVAKYKRVGGP